MNIDLSTIHQAQAGNPKAQKDIFDAFFGLLIERGAKTFRLGHQTEDVAIQTLTKVLEKLKEFIPRTDAVAHGLFSWIYAIHHNCSIDAIRGFKRRPTIAIDLCPEELPLETKDPPNFGTRDEVLEALRYLQKLPKETRRIMHLKISGETDAEIAERINRPVGTVKAKIRRTRRLLQTSLNS